MTPAAFRAARKTLGLTQGELAAALRLKDARAIRYYEAGGREISGPILVALAYMLEDGPILTGDSSLVSLSEVVNCCQVAERETNQ